MCNACNELFNPLETNFLEDSMEGVLGQRLNLENRKSVTIRGVNLQVAQEIGPGDEFFNQMFIFLKSEGDRIVADFKNQVKIRGFRDGHFRVFTLVGLVSIRTGTTDFEKLKRELANLDPKGIAIFAEDRETKERLISELHRFGVNYKEGSEVATRLEPGDDRFVEHEMSGTINPDIGRVLAKIAFNYFAFCAMKQRTTDVLYAANFDEIRTFIHDGSGALRRIIASISEEPILLDEAQSERRAIAHMITFKEEDGIVIVRMTFFGVPMVYKVILGTMPDALRNPRFGCGHLFDPFVHKIFPLTQDPSNATGEPIHRTFGLFKRIPN